MDKTYSIITFGCTFNKGDSQKIRNILNSNHFNEIKKIEESDLIIINTCAVKHATQMKIENFISTKFKEFPKKFFIITGCLPFISLKTKNKIEKIINSRGFILHPHQISQIYDKIVEFFKLEEEILSLSDRNNRDKSYLFPFIENKNIPAIIQISEGCNNRCSYCCTTNARGNLVSFKKTNIIKQIKNLKNQKIKEFFITSQDLGNYLYKNLQLHDLLNEISEIEGDLKFRLGMLNPEYLILNIDSFLKIFDDPRFYRFIHIPIQSGSNRILHKMNRNYTIEEVEKIIRKLKTFDSKFTFSTDLIVGFPSETKMDHHRSIKFIKKWKPTVLNISKFSVRPKTVAKKMPQLKSQVIKKRSREISEIYKDIFQKNLSKWINWKGEIYINEFHPKREYPYMARNNYYIPVLLKRGTLGQSKIVQIKKILNHALIAE